MTVPYTFAYSTGDVPLAELDANFASVANNVSTANTAVFVTGNNQSNITSVGTLTSLNVSGNVTAGSFVGNLVGYADTAGSAAFATVAGTANTAGSAAFANVANGAVVAATVTTAAQPNITSVGTLTSLSSTGNITADFFFGNIQGSLSNAIYACIAGYATTANTAGTVTVNAQPNITSVGVLTSLSSTGNITSDHLNATITNFVELYCNNVNSTSLFSNNGIFFELDTGNLYATANIFTGNLYAATDIFCERNILVNTGYVVAGNGLLTTAEYNGLAQDGIIIDYEPGAGRIRLGDEDSLEIYNNASNVLTLTAAFDATGSLILGVTGTANLTAGNVNASGNVSGNNISAITAFQLPVYANVSARNAAITNPTVGMLVVVGNTYQGYNGVTWGNITLS